MGVTRSIPSFDADRKTGKQLCGRRSRDGKDAVRAGDGSVPDVQRRGDDCPRRHLHEDERADDVGDRVQCPDFMEVHLVSRSVDLRLGLGQKTKAAALRSFTRGESGLAPMISRTSASPQCG